MDYFGFLYSNQLSSTEQQQHQIQEDGMGWDGMR